MKHKIALLPGDGIGVEVVREAVKCLRALEPKFPGTSFECTEFDWGTKRIVQKGAFGPDKWLETLRPFDAILLGALGDPRLAPDDVTLRPLLDIRQGFNEYVNLRPITLPPGVQSPLRGKDKIDFAVIRENTEGEYANQGAFENVGQANERALQTNVFTRKGCTRIFRYAFELTRKRAQERGRPGLLTCVTKNNAQKFSMVFWNKIFDEVAKDFADVRTEKMHVDAMAMDFIRRPERLDVVVASNLFGDILTDLGAMIVGGLGFAPSANINPDRTAPSMFEPVHGSAPDIAGKGLANPVATLYATALMLKHLKLEKPAELLQKAIEKVLTEAKVRTPDMGGNSTTAQVGDAVAAAITR